MKTSNLQRLSIGAAAAALLMLAACSSNETPTSSRNSTITGQVVMGASTQGTVRPQAASGPGNIMIRVESSDASAMTDASGNFTMTRVPPGADTLSFERSDIHARAAIQVPAGSTVSVTVSIHGNQATIVPGGHPGVESEGVVQTVDAGGGTLTVADQRLGTVTIATNDTTSIRHGAVAITLAQITAGMEVHVKATDQGGGTYLATEILVQDLKIGGSQTVSGTIASIDSGASTFVVHGPLGDVTIATNAATIFEKNGMAAAFGDLAMGMRVTVRGTLQSDGSILAALVTVNG